VAGQGVPDIPAPSINPMAIMPASNVAEQTHRVQQELDVIQHSPPLQQQQPQQQQQQVFTANVIHPPDDESGAEGQGADLDLSEYYESDDQLAMDGVDISDYSTPPPFSPPSNPSFENTPATMMSDRFSASPSPGLPSHSHETLMGIPAAMNPGERHEMNMYHNIDHLSPHAQPVSPNYMNAPYNNMDHLGPHGQSDSPQTFRCDICGREFDLYHKLNHHRRYHERPHECPHNGCDKRFGTKTHLDRHINDKHEKKRKFHCTEIGCPYSRQGGKAFPRKDNWRRHMQNKHQIDPQGEPPMEIDGEDDGMTGA